MEELHKRALLHERNLLTVAHMIYEMDKTEKRTVPFVSAKQSGKKKKKKSSSADKMDDGVEGAGNDSDREESQPSSTPSNDFVHRASCGVHVTWKQTIPKIMGSSKKIFERVITQYWSIVMEMAREMIRDADLVLTLLHLLELTANELGSDRTHFVTSILYCVRRAGVAFDMVQVDVEKWQTEESMKRALQWYDVCPVDGPLDAKTLSKRRAYTIERSYIERETWRGSGRSTVESLKAFARSKGINIDTWSADEVGKSHGPGIQFRDPRRKQRSKDVGNEAASSSSSLTIHTSTTVVHVDQTAVQHQLYEVWALEPKLARYRNDYATKAEQILLHEEKTHGTKEAIVRKMLKRAYQDIWTKSNFLAEDVPEESVEPAPKKSKKSAKQSADAKLERQQQRHVDNNKKKDGNPSSKPTSSSTTKRSNSDDTTKQSTMKTTSANNKDVAKKKKASSSSVDTHNEEEEENASEEEEAQGRTKKTTATMNRKPMEDSDSSRAKKTTTTLGTKRKRQQVEEEEQAEKTSRSTSLMKKAADKNRKDQMDVEEDGMDEEDIAVPSLPPPPPSSSKKKRTSSTKMIPFDPVETLGHVSMSVATAKEWDEIRAMPLAHRPGGLTRKPVHISCTKHYTGPYSIRVAREYETVVRILYRVHVLHNVLGIVGIQVPHVLFNPDKTEVYLVQNNIAEIDARDLEGEQDRGWDESVKLQDGRTVRIINPVYLGTCEVSKLIEFRRFDRIAVSCFELLLARYWLGIGDAQLKNLIVRDEWAAAFPSRSPPSSLDDAARNNTPDREGKSFSTPPLQQQQTPADDVVYMIHLEDSREKVPEYEIQDSVEEEQDSITLLQIMFVKNPKEYKRVVQVLVQCREQLMQTVERWSKMDVDAIVAQEFANKIAYGAYLAEETVMNRLDTIRSCLNNMMRHLCKERDNLMAENRGSKTSKKSKTTTAVASARHKQGKKQREEDAIVCTHKIIVVRKKKDAVHDDEERVINDASPALLSNSRKADAATVRGGEEEQDDDFVPSEDEEDEQD